MVCRVPSGSAPISGRAFIAGGSIDAIVLAGPPAASHGNGRVRSRGSFYARRKGIDA